MNSEERAKRLAAMKEAKERQLKKRAMVKKYAPLAGGGLCVLLIAGVIIVKAASAKSAVYENDTNVVNEEMATVQSEINEPEPLQLEEEIENFEENILEEEEKEILPETIKLGDIEVKYGYDFAYTYETVDLPEDENKVASEFGILVDLETGEVVGKKKSLERMYPASMTKVLTVLVAAEHIKEEELDNSVTISIEATDYSWKHKCSNVGFLVDEVVTVRDLFYGTILPSGGDAAYALACYVAGSHEAFVELMNEKVKELGLSETTHFTNCVGVFDKEHYTTPYDMAVIMKAAIENDFIRDVTSLHTYTTSVTKEHTDGIIISNWFLRRIEDKLKTGEVQCAKTGFVNQSGCCAVSYYLSETQRPYICVTGNAFSSWRAIYDHQNIYEAYTK